MKFIRFSNEAGKDIEGISQWYEKQLPGLGIRFIDELNLLLLQISRQPEMYPLYKHKTRKAVLKKFPVGTFYFVLPDSLKVIAVFHFKRNPKTLEKRF